MECSFNKGLIFQYRPVKAYGGVVPKEASRHLSDRLSDDIGGWRTSVKNAFCGASGKEVSGDK